MAVSAGRPALPISDSETIRVAALSGTPVVPLAIIDGTDGNDTLNGTEQADRINGLAGGDSLYGNGGDDSLSGGGGGDFLDGGDGNDWLNTDFDDVWYDDTLHGGAGDDTLISGYGNDDLYGDDGNDVLISGHARLSSGTAGDTDGDALYGGAGDDILIGSGMSDTLYGGEGDDILMGGDGQDVLYSDPGADLLDGGAGKGRDYLDYRSSDAAVRINLQTNVNHGGHAEGDIIRNIDVIRGSAFGDTMIGNAADNNLYGNEGDDTLAGGGGDDYLLGGEGNDILQGGAGDDLIEGREGADQIDGGDGQDTMQLYSFEGMPGGVTVDLAAGTASGGAIDPGDTFRNIEGVSATDYDDILNGDENDNIFTGYLGGDIINGKGGSDTVVYNGMWVGGDGTGHGVGVRVDLMTSSVSGADASYDRISSIENAIGSGYSDSLRGSDDSNYLSGGRGQDSLSGAGGDDVLVDPDGFDWITGGTGADTFVFNAGTTSLITDFTPSDGDKIDLREFYGPSEFGNEAPQNLTFIGYGGFTGKAGELNLVHDDSSTTVQIDLDGDGGVDSSIILNGFTETLDTDSFLL